MTRVSQDKPSLIICPPWLKISKPGSDSCSCVSKYLTVNNGMFFPTTANLRGGINNYYFYLKIRKTIQVHLGVLAAASIQCLGLSPPTLTLSTNIQPCYPVPLCYFEKDSERELSMCLAPSSKFLCLSHHKCSLHRVNRPVFHSALLHSGSRSVKHSEILFSWMCVL